MQNSKKLLKVYGIEATLTTYLCPSCGTSIKCPPDSCIIACSSCRHEISLNTQKLTRTKHQHVSNESYAKTLDTHDVVCSSCGHMSLVESSNKNYTCPACQRQQDIDFKGQAPNHRVGQGLLPFKLTEDEAVQAFMNWCHDRFDQDAKSSIGGSVQSLFIPYWLISCHGALPIITKKATHSPIQVPSLVPINIDDQLFMASNLQMIDLIEGKVPDVDVKEALVYDSRYTAGHLVGTYTHSHSEVIRTYLEDYIHANPIENYVGLALTNLGPELTLEASPLYLPFYYVHYKMNGKSYLTFINGYTGTIEGSLKLDHHKAARKASRKAFIESIHQRYGKVINMIHNILSLLLGGFMIYKFLLKPLLSMDLGEIISLFVILILFLLLAIWLMPKDLRQDLKSWIIEAIKSKGKGPV